MKNINVIFPVDFDEFAWEVELKGWCDILVEADGMSFQLSFYDSERLMQEIKSCLSRSPFFLEQNIIVLQKINRDSIEKAIASMIEPNYFVKLRPEDRKAE